MAHAASLILLALALFAVLLLMPVQVMAQEPAPGWSAVETISRPEEVASSPTLTTDASGLLHVFWEARPRDRQDAVSAIVYSRLQKGAWSTPVEIVISPNGGNALFSRAIVDRTGRLHLFWSATQQGPFGPLYHSWAPADNAVDARQWQPAQGIADGTYQADVRLDSQGRLHLLYASVLDGAGICHVVSADQGESWSERSCIDRYYPLRDEEYDVRPRLAIDSQDKLHAVWVLDDYSPESRLAYSARGVFYARSSDGGATWSEPLVVDEIDGRGDYDSQVDGRQPAWGNSIVDGSDRVHIVWVGRPDMQRYHQWSGDGGVTWSAREVAIPSGGYNNWQGLAVDDANRLHLLWPSLKGLEYAYWDGAGWSEAVLISDQGGPHHAQAAVALGNQLHVVWQDHGGNRNAQDLGHVQYAMLQTEAPGREPEAVPTVTQAGQVTPTAPATTAAPTATTELPERAELGSAEAIPAAGISLNAVALALIPVVALLAIVLLLQIRKR